MRHRRFAKAERNEGFVAMLSALALIILDPTEGSFAQDGTKPHRSAVNSLRNTSSRADPPELSGAAVTARTSVVGATL